MDSSHPPAAGSGASEGRTVTKKELVARIAERTGVTKVVAKDIIQRFLDEIIRELGRGNRLEFREFGVFEIKGRAARRAQNPRTLEKVDVPAKRIVRFKVGREMRARVCDEPLVKKRSDGQPASKDARVEPPPPLRQPSKPANNSPF